MGANRFFAKLSAEGSRRGDGGRQDPVLDERFVMHRFKSTRIAVLVGMIMIFGFFTYYAVAAETIRWDLFSVMTAMAVVKICAMLYYRKTN